MYHARNESSVSIGEYMSEAEELNDKAMYLFPEAYFVSVSDKYPIYVLTNEAKKLLYPKQRKGFNFRDYK